MCLTQVTSTWTTPRAKTMNQLTRVPSHCFCFKAVGGPSRLGEYSFASSEMYRFLPFIAWRILSYCRCDPGMIEAQGSYQTTCCAQKAASCPQRKRYLSPRTISNCKSCASKKCLAYWRSHMSKPFENAKCSSPG